LPLVAVAVNLVALVLQENPVVPVVEEHPTLQIQAVAQELLDRAMLVVQVKQYHLHLAVEAVALAVLAVMETQQLVVLVVMDLHLQLQELL
jgi:hypothetical protein